MSGNCGEDECITTSRSGCGNGRLRSRTPLTMLNIAALAPMPSASVRMATTAEPGRGDQHTDAVAEVLEERGHRGLPCCAVIAAAKREAEPVVRREEPSACHPPSRR
jgi:hypothetical protein